MEVLNQLEQRVADLLAKLEFLEQKNSTLQQGYEEKYTALMEENASLRETLQQEQQRNALALSRIDAVIQRIKEQTE